MNDETASTLTEDEVPFRYVHSTGFPNLLEHLGASLFVSTYQAGKLVTFRSAAGRMSMLPRTFEQAMGLAIEQDRIAIGTRYQIWLLRNDPTLAQQFSPTGRHDACYLPRTSHVTGDINVHEMAWCQDELWVVNTRFSCLCTLDPNYSFVPRWRPPFVTELAAEDRCHLNGLAAIDGKVKYVTAFAETDTKEGWRPKKTETGVLIDITNGETVTRGLTMPHSPRVHADRLWVLDSGTGRVLVVDPSSGRTMTFAELPGYTRGLAFYDRYAFVGLSQIRETATFGSVPIAQRPEQLKCGVWVLNLDTSETVAVLEFDRGVTEIFDVAVLPGIRFPTVEGFQKDAIKDAFVLPPERENI